MDAFEKLTPSTWPDNPETATIEGKNKVLGFWLFLAGEAVIFGCLFAVYLALKNHGADPNMATTSELFELPLTFIATLILLTSSLSSAFAMYFMRNFQYKKMELCLFITVFLGACFLLLEVYEFHHYITEFGHTPTSSAFGSAFYMLVGTHGLHVLFGLIWISTLLLKNANRGLNLYNAPKFYLATLYWHFIDVVWVFIFTVVYLMGKVS